MPTKLKDVAKQLEAATKELDKERQEWRVKSGKIKRANIQLTAVNRDLSDKNKAAQEELDKLKSDIATEIDRHEALKDRNTVLEQENHRLEGEAAQTKAELEKITTDLELKKATLDKELEDYSIARKQAIKAEILNENKELEQLKYERNNIVADIELKRTELKNLNDVYATEQEEIKNSSLETKRLLAENAEKLATSNQEIETAELKLKEIYYEHDKVQLSLTKARQDHDKFLEYEKKARKLLETKDRQLQERQADIDQENQFLKSKRSILSEL